MVKNKNNIIKLLNEIKSLTYLKGTSEINVDKSIDTDLFEYKDGISMLYKDRKD
ncbi:hypothetical protein [Clostridium sp.]|uniref:hypothetical protein n=1 Tax=Clostridium sp. TaxID=1506 RepID=UPI003D6CA729